MTLQLALLQATAIVGGALLIVPLARLLTRLFKLDRDPVIDDLRSRMPRRRRLRRRFRRR